MSERTITPMERKVLEVLNKRPRGDRYAISGARIEREIDGIKFYMAVADALDSLWNKHMIWETLHDPRRYCITLLGISALQA